MGKQNLYDFKAEIRFNDKIRFSKQKLGFKAIYLEEKDSLAHLTFFLMSMDIQHLLKA